MSKSTLTIIGDSKEYFRESLREALVARRVETYPFVESYLVDVLNFYVLTANLFVEEESSGKKSRETLAELLLRANSTSGKQRFDLLKKLGDSALYISGYFGDSLQRKIVDVDYYIDMGALAYDSLAHETYEDTFSKLYSEISAKFNVFVDVFTVMSRKAQVQDNDNLLRLMDLYARTGSPTAKEILMQKGVFANTDQLKKIKNQ